VHLAAAVPNFAWMEVRVSPTERREFPDDEIFPQQHKLDGSVFPVPDTPGLGIEVNEDYLQSESFKFWEAPHLHRRDGSYTNW
jgi:galactonate dehydratase